MAGFYSLYIQGGTIAIYDEGILLTNAATSINFTGAGILGTVIGTAVTENVPGAAGSISIETPAGLINDVNTVFTVANAPIFIVQNGQVLTAGGVDYTLAGGGPYTITFVVAPQTGSILRSYY